MRNILAVAFVLLLSCAPAVAQQPPNAATKQDVEELFVITGVRTRIQQMWTQMSQQIAATAGESYRLKYPDATPMQAYKVGQVASRSYQSSLSVISVDELLNAIIPVYQKHLSHADMQAILAFYHSDAGKKYLKEQSAMQAESMEAIQPIIKKHLPEMQAAADKAVQQTLYPYTKPSANSSHTSK
jgi:hypothetical protein